MTRIAVVYHSLHGHTEVIGKCAAQGAAAVGSVDVDLIRLRPEEVQEARWRNDETLKRIEAADRVILGSPTFMGSLSAVMKAFMETASVPWTEQKWKDKFATGSRSAICLETTGAAEGRKTTIALGRGLAL